MGPWGIEVYAGAAGSPTSVGLLLAPSLDRLADTPASAAEMMLALGACIAVQACRTGRITPPGGLPTPPALPYDLPIRWLVVEGGHIAELAPLGDETEAIGRVYFRGDPAAWGSLLFMALRALRDGGAVPTREEHTGGYTTTLFAMPGARGEA